MRGKPAYARARILAVLGRTEQAVTALTQAFQQGYRWSIALHTDPAFDGIRGNRAFKELVKPKG